MSNIQKPITVARNDFINGMTTLINESGLPPFIIEPILKDMLHDVKLMAQRQLENDTNEYQQRLAEFERTNGIENCAS